MRRIPMLDGWRAVSILLVLAGHLLPLGPSGWRLNFMSAAAGMAIFFTLSGFLITSFLLDRPDVVQFLVRRLFRIVPLAWLAMLVLVVATGADLTTALANLGFYANVVPTNLMLGGDHLWSLCVEVQFYLGVAILVLVAGRRGLYVLPVLAVVVTTLKIEAHQFASIATQYRIDEILAGCILALAHHHLEERGWRPRLPTLVVLVAGVLVLVTSHEGVGPIGYFRPYAAAAAVGFSLYAAPAWLSAVLCSRPMRYVAEISYALYVIHGMLSHSWLGAGDTVVKYAKRPVLFLAVWACAHVSTFYFERPMQALGKRVGARLSETSRRASSAA